MLYDRWREIAREFSSEVALWDWSGSRRWTFAALDRFAETDTSAQPVAFPSGHSPEFVIEVLRAWRKGQIVCPLELGQARPEFPLPPPGIVHLKLTSATTGSPKLVAFTGDQLAADADNIVATMGLRPDSPNLAFISLAHSYGFSNLVTPLLLHGIPLVLGGAPLPEMFRRATESFPATTVPAVPALWRTWHESGVLNPNVRLAISAGAPLPLPLENDVYNRAGIKIHNFYGATECGGIAYDTSDVPRTDTAHVGMPLRNVGLSINADGCLEVRGRNVGESYWPGAIESLQNGCYRTSDFAEIQNRNVILRGRASDVINVAGRKVSPESIEHLLQQHQAVRDCLVFGIHTADFERGDTIVACVVADGVTPDALRQFLLERTAAWQVPREFWLVDALRANPRGKVSRTEWRQRFLAR